MTALQAHDQDMIVSAPERRSGEDRYVSIFRAGKLVRAGGEELCVLRNISVGGAMIAHNSDLEIGDHVRLDLRLDENLEARVAWIKGDRCGLAFDAPADLPRILAGHTLGPKPRPPRVRHIRMVRLLVGQKSLDVELRDISQTGACFAVDERTLPRDPEFRVFLEGLGDYRAIVCWRRGGFVGVNFASTLQMWPLNDWIRASR